ncbi:unnamed protein product, partial [Effrenium voratum]
VLERIWATAGRQPGSGYFYKVTTENPYGIGIRDEPDINGPRTGEDLIRGSVFEVDELVEVEDDLTYLHLADQRGWVFDNSVLTPDDPCVVNLADIEPGCTVTMWRGEVDELAKTIGLKFRQDSNDGQPFTMTVLEEGQPIQRVPIAPGSNLRKTLLANGFQVYQDLRSVFNCNANQLCGTCVLDVMEGTDNLTVRSVNEAAVMAANPPSFRLCCNIDVYGDVTVRLRPRGVKYGGGFLAELEAARLICELGYTLWTHLEFIGLYERKRSSLLVIASPELVAKVEKEITRLLLANAQVLARSCAEACVQVWSTLQAAQLEASVAPSPQAPAPAATTQEVVPPADVAGSSQTAEVAQAAAGEADLVREASVPVQATPATPEEVVQPADVAGSSQPAEVAEPSAGVADLVRPEVVPPADVAGSSQTAEAAQAAAGEADLVRPEAEVPVEATPATPEEVVPPVDVAGSSQPSEVAQAAASEADLVRPEAEVPVEATPATPEEVVPPVDVAGSSQPSE